MYWNLRVLYHDALSGCLSLQICNMVMEDDDNTAVMVTGTQMDIKKGGDVEDKGACTDTQQETVVHQAGSNRAAGRGDRNGTEARVATGIRVLKAGHNFEYFC